MTTADAYGPLAELTQLVDEYYQVELTDPSKLPILQQQIWELIRQSHLDEDLQRMMTEDHGHTHEWDDGTTEEGTPLSLASMQGTEIAHVIEELDAYLCQLTGAQIRDGLHVLGDAPDGEQLVGLLQAMTRLPNLELPSLRDAVASFFGLDLAALLDGGGSRLNVDTGSLSRVAERPLVTHSDVLEAVDDICLRLLSELDRQGFRRDRLGEAMVAVLGDTIPSAADAGNSEHAGNAADSGHAGNAANSGHAESAESTGPDAGPEPASRDTSTGRIARVLDSVCDWLVPNLRQTSDEIDHLLHGLDGGHVPAGPSGAPTRGMAHILPTGRNFYAVDPRAVPSAAAWRVGQELAREVLERHLDESGDYPETVGISVWGTSNMRTHGDDIAQILALMGVRPTWQKENRRLTGIETIPLEELGRPRIDVVMRISGFFRDAFPHLIRLLDEAVETVVHLDEPPEENFLRKHYLAEVEPAVEEGECEFDVDRRARYRIFGAKPGSYGAGILPLIDERNWRDQSDFAEAFINWGGYAYTADDDGVDAREVFQQRLSGVQVALHNQDNREHDIFDSDDYLQFHGGMIATIRALTGHKPRHYFGDTQDPSRPAVRDLKEEALRVFRTRVVNPKWIESIRRHGYKGGLELNATVDYLFGFDATAEVVDDWMYEEVARAYALDPEMQEFFQQSNPWALHAIAERLLEANQRDMWKQADPRIIEQLEQTLLDSEAGARPGLQETGTV